MILIIIDIILFKDVLKKNKKGQMDKDNGTKHTSAGDPTLGETFNLPASGKGAFF